MLQQRPSRSQPSLWWRGVFFFYLSPSLWWMSLMDLHSINATCQAAAPSSNQTTVSERVWQEENKRQRERRENKRGNKEERKPATVTGCNPFCIAAQQTLWFIREFSGGNRGFTISKWALIHPHSKGHTSCSLLVLDLHPKGQVPMLLRKPLFSDAVVQSPQYRPEQKIRSCCICFLQVSYYMVLTKLIRNKNYHYSSYYYH